MTAATVGPAALAAMLTPAPAAGLDSCTPTTVCPQHQQQYPNGPVGCRANCGEHLAPLLWPHGLHAGCTEPAPIPGQLTITAPAAAASPFAAPAGPKTHPIKQELIDLIRWAAADAPRSRQVAVGPSEIGVDCMRRLAYRYTGTAACNTASDPWFSIVGTAVHDWLDIAINQYNAKVLGPPDGTREFAQRRYWTEERVTATADQHGVSGSCDLYDADRQTVIDHKVVGPTPLKKYRDSGPSNQYRIQVHLYGLGHAQAGRPVTEVAIAFYPRNGYLTDLHVWSEPYQPQIALDALGRAATVQQMAAVLPPALIPAHTDQAACTWCPFYRPGGPADATGCPGPQGG